MLIAPNSPPCPSLVLEMVSKIYHLPKVRGEAEWLVVPQVLVLDLL